MAEMQTDTTLQYKHRTEYGARTMSIVLNKFMMSLICFMASLGSTKWGMDLLGLTEENFSVLMIPLAVTALCFVMLSFHNRDITNGIVLMLLSMSQLTNSISELAFDSTYLTWQHVFFVVGFGAAAYIYHTRGQSDKYPCLILCAVLVLATVFHQHGNIITTLGYYACGMLYLFSASYRLYLHCVKKEFGRFIRIHLDESRSEYDITLFNTAGMLSFSILSIYLCFYIFEGADAFTLYIVKTVVSSICLMFAFFAMSRGIIDEGVMLFCTSINVFIFSLMNLMGFPEPLFLSILTSVINIALAVKFLKEKKNYIFALMNLILFVVFVLEFFFFYAKYAGASLTLLRILTCTVAVCSWVEYETGVAPLRIVRLFKDKYISPMKIKRDLTPYVTSGVLLLWLGSNFILFNYYPQLNVEMFLVVSAILAVPALYYVKNLFKDGLLSEGMLTFLICSSTLILSVLRLTFGGSVPLAAYMMFFVAALICSLIFLYHRNTTMVFASMALMMTHMTQIYSGNPYPVASGLLYIAAGVIMMSDTFLTVLVGDRWEKHLMRSELHISRKSNPVLSTIPLVMYLLSVTCLLFTFKYTGYELSILNIYLAIILLIASFYGLIKGDVYSFPVVMMVVSVSITDAFTFIMGTPDSYVIYIPLIIIGLISAIPLYKNGRKLLGIACMLCGLLAMVGIATNVWDLVWSGFGILGLVSFLYATNMWITHDTKWCPTKHLLFLDLYKSKKDRCKNTVEGPAEGTGQ